MAKKGIVVLVIIIAVVFAQATPGMASNSVYSYFKMVKLVIGQTLAEVNYKPATMDQAAYIKQGRTLIPLRFIGESLGAVVTWRGETKQAVLELADTTMTVTLGSKVAYVDGELTVLDVPAEMKSGRVFVPLRFVSESFGGYVDYDSETKTVMVRCTDETNWKSYTGPTTGLQYRYPTDWTVSTDAGGWIDIFESPNGSKLRIYNTEVAPKEYDAIIKQAAKDNGWTVDSEVLNTPGNPNDGYRLGLRAFDKTINSFVFETIYVDPVNGGSFVVDQLMDDDYADIDSIVMLDIAYS